MRTSGQSHVWCWDVCTGGISIRLLWPGTYPQAQTGAGQKFLWPSQIAIESFLTPVLNHHLRRVWCAPEIRPGNSRSPRLKRRIDAGMISRIASRYSPCPLVFGVCGMSSEKRSAEFFVGVVHSRPPPVICSRHLLCQFVRHTDARWPFYRLNRHKKQSIH